ncbi:MAG: AAA family ATPase [Candidatus Norongarragalinales archaeon]
MKRNRTIGIVSGKGGVGKTVTAVNLSVLLSRDGINTLLVDSDVQNPSVGLHVGFASMHVGFQDVLSGKIALEDALVEHPQSRLKILPASLKPSYRVPIQNFEKFVRLIEEDYELTIVDSPPSVLDYVQKVITGCDEVIIVTTPDLPSIMSANKVIAFAEQRRTKVFGVVLNRVRGKAYELPVKEVEVLTNYRVLASIPEDDAVPLSIALQQPVVQRFPDSDAALKFVELAEEVAMVPLRRAQQSRSFTARLIRFLRWFNPFKRY